MLTKKEVNKIFHEVELEDNYNFLEDDLHKLANAFVRAARPAIMKEELATCAEIVGHLNPNVGAKLLEVRVPVIKSLEANPCE